MKFVFEGFSIRIPLSQNTTHPPESVLDGQSISWNNYVQASSSLQTTGSYASIVIDYKVPRHFLIFEVLLDSVFTPNSNDIEVRVSRTLPASTKGNL